MLHRSGSGMNAVAGQFVRMAVRGQIKSLDKDVYGGRHDARTAIVSSAPRRRFWRCLNNLGVSG